MRERTIDLLLLVILVTGFGLALVLGEAEARRLGPDPRTRPRRVRYLRGIPRDVGPDARLKPRLICVADLARLLAAVVISVYLIERVTGLLTQQHL